MKRLLIILTTLSFNLCLGQYNYDGSREAILIDNFTEGKFTVYDTSKYKIPIIRTEKEVDWSKIEHVVLSKLYANTRPWALKVYEDTTGRSEEDSYYSRIKEINPADEYIKPFCLYTYKVGDEEAAFLLLTWHSRLLEGEIPLMFDAVKKNGRWYESSRLTLFGIRSVFVEFNENALSQTFEGKTSENEMINALMQKVRVNGVVSIPKLYDELNFLKANKDTPEYKYLTRSTRIAKYPTFKEGILQDTYVSKVIQSMKLVNCQNYKYEEWEFSKGGVLTNKKWVSELTILKNAQISKTDTLRFLRRITFTFYDKPISIIKYQIGKNVKANVLELANNQWIITDNPKFENIRLSLQYIKVQHWDDFFSGDEMKKEPIIKKYSPIYIQKMHNWNLDRLGEILKTKPNDLAKYCDYD